MLIQFSSDRAKIEVVSLKIDTAFQSRQISKRGSTSAAGNSALNIPYPLCHTHSEPSGHEDTPGIT